MFCLLLRTASNVVIHSPRGAGLRNDTEKALSADSAWETELRTLKRVHVSPPKSFRVKESEGLTVGIDLQAAYYTRPPNEVTMERSLPARPWLNSLSQHLI